MRCSHCCILLCLCRHWAEWSQTGVNSWTPASPCVRFTRVWGFEESAALWSRPRQGSLIFFVSFLSHMDFQKAPHPHCGVGFTSAGRVHSEGAERSRLRSPTDAPPPPLTITTQRFPHSLRTVTPSTHVWVSSRRMWEEAPRVGYTEEDSGGGGGVK